MARDPPPDEPGRKAGRRRSLGRQEGQRQKVGQAFPRPPQRRRQKPSRPQRQAGQGRLMRLWPAVAGLAGFASVVVGALGAHALGDPAAQALAERASLYGLVHALLLLWLARHSGKTAFAARGPAPSPPPL